MKFIIIVLLVAVSYMVVKHTQSLLDMPGRMPVLAFFGILGLLVVGWAVVLEVLQRGGD